MKRDIIKFSCDNPAAINLDMLTSMNCMGTRVNFYLNGNTMFIDSDTEDQAKAIYESILKSWCGDKEESKDCSHS